MVLLFALICSWLIRREIGRSVENDFLIVQPRRTESLNTIQRPKADSKPAIHQEEVVGEKTVYTNEEYGIQLQYPKNWFRYDEHTWMQDHERFGCEPSGSMENTLILSEEDLGSCVAVVLWESWAGDFIVRSYEGNWVSFPYVLGRDGSELTTVSDRPAVKYASAMATEGPRKGVTKIYFNHENRGYIIEYKDHDLSRIPVYEQVVSSFRLLQFTTAE